MAELFYVIECDKPDIICLTEILPKNSNLFLQSCEIKIEGYQCFTNITNPVDGMRGIAMYVRDSIPAQQVNLSDTESKINESVWCEVNLENKEKLLIGTMYRSPSSSDTNNDNFNQLFKNMILDRKNVLIMGDFNHPEINWLNGISPANENNKATQFLEMIRDTFLHQHIKQPTHHRGEQRPTLIDLIFTSEEGNVNDIQHKAPLGKSHHQSIVFQYVCKTSDLDDKRQRFIYDKGNYTEMRQDFEKLNFTSKIENLKVQEAWDLFSEKIELLCKKHIPMSGKNNRKTKRKPLWMNEKAMAKVKKKQSAYKRYLETKEGQEYLIYAKARNQAKWECKKAMKEYEREIAKSAKKNPKRFYAYAKSKLNTNHAIPDLVNENNEKISDDADKADLLNKFFCSVFTNENLNHIPEPTPKIENDCLDTVEISKEKVEKLLAALDPGKSEGADGMNPKILKELSHQLAEPMTMIFRKSLDEGTLPEQWKSANVTPLFKKGDKSKANNYRPVSLTSIPCKLMERVLRDSMFEYLEKNDALSPCQHGFVSKRSCVTNLVDILDNWTASLDEGVPIDAIYLDFSKAFDCVPHQRLLKKLESYGISGNLRNWLESFLTDRKQRVKVNGHMSSWEKVTSGVPQGSVLGPVLFVLFINDLPDVVRSMCSMYADDTKVYDSAINHEKLQKDLDNLVNWADDWQMKFNAGKCSVLHIGRNNNLHEYSIRIHNSTERVKLNPSDMEKDLGVYIDSELKFSKHVETQVNKANKILGLIRRSYEYLDCETMRLLFIALVRPHLEFANCAWGPTLEKDKNLIEGVLHRATKCVPGLKDLKYEERLKAMKIPSMSFRRFRGDLIEIYKYTHGLYNCKSPFEIDQTGRTRGHNYKLIKQACNTTQRLKFFTIRAVDSWNKLDPSIVNAKTLNSFKNSIDKVFENFKYENNVCHPISAKPRNTKTTAE